MRSPWLALAIVALALAAGCGPTPALTPTPLPTPTLLSNPSESPLATLLAGPVVKSGTLDQSVTTPALDFRSTGEWLVWSTGARANAQGDVAPDLYGAQPGETPVLLYDNPDRDSRLEVAGGFGSRFAFIEANTRTLGRSGWRLWYLKEPNGDAEIVDEGSGGQLPFFSMSATRLVWVSIEAVQGAKGTIKSFDIASGTKSVLLSAPANAQTFWFPWLDGEHLVYGAVESADGGETEERHAYYLDLSVAGGMPKKLDSSGSASEPVIRGDVVIWKESDPELHFLSAGKLVRHSLATGETEPLSLPAGDATLGFTTPSIGNHYAVAWPQYVRAIYLADLAAGTFPALIDLGPSDEDPQDAVVRPFLIGDLLAYTFGPAGKDLELRWAQLR